MLSPNGKLNVLAETNRVEAMDAVINLREIYAVISAEQSAESQHRQPRVFVLKYARASEVRNQLQTLLGIETKPATAEAPSPQNAEQQAQQAETMARMQRERSGGGQGRSGGQEQSGGQAAPSAPAKPKVLITLVADDRKNSILASASPDKMAIIAQAIVALDVPVEAANRWWAI